MRIAAAGSRSLPGCVSGGSRQDTKAFSSSKPNMRRNLELVNHDDHRVPTVDLWLKTLLGWSVSGSAVDLAYYAVRKYLVGSIEVAKGVFLESSLAKLSRSI